MTHLRNRIGPWLPTAVAIVVALVTGPSAIATKPAVVPATLKPTARAPIRLELNLPTDPGRALATWDTANVAQLFVRSAGEQKSYLPLGPAPGQRHVSLEVERAGPALLCIGVGPPEERGHSDSWQRVTHCTKIVLNVQPRDPAATAGSTSNPGITAKTGQKVEILPLVDPTRLRQGDDLPVRVYYEGVKVKGALITATVHQGDLAGAGVTINAARQTDAHGTTWLPVTHAGTWVVRFSHQVEGRSDAPADSRQYVAELIFEVPEGGPR
ncbi:MAG: DUF4198 domain-containing protein [Planctomycetota bacterium]